MDQTARKIKYNQSLAYAIQELFCAYIVPANFLSIIHKHAPHVLTSDDVARLRKKVHNSGMIDKEISQEILDLMVRYKDWYPAIIKILGDESMRQKDLIGYFNKVRKEHDEKFYRENPVPVVESQLAEFPPKLATDSVNHTPNKKKPQLKPSQSVDGASPCRGPQQSSAKNSLQANGDMQPTSDNNPKKKQGKLRPDVATKDKPVNPATNLVPDSPANGPQKVKSGPKKKSDVSQVQAASQQAIPNEQQKPAPVLQSQLSASGHDMSYCDICKAKFTSAINAEEHYSGQKHKRNLESLEKNKEPTIQQSANPQPSAIPAPESKPSIYFLNENGQGYCNLCQVKFASLSIAEDHLKGSKHKASIATLNAKK
ncbi:tyrosine-protein kinase Fer [Biomphalaria pfeifferi]|uniref:Tyrosine-protein kinase Fer n=1 Tax=Biomphalaria pfeifferi TaxID=112525 RepID=A0AAD8AQQ4_BIOPF|nr:tyrosine-protein kinase Fer [Biomphalaria pfeifferi]